jgi:zinc protease
MHGFRCHSLEATYFLKNMKTSIFLFCVFLGSLRAVPSAETIAATQIDIPYQKFVLSNGLTLIVHEDHKAPIVAVNLYFHVGSKNEKIGKTGFAHLFEHLMFTGSDHFKGTGNQRAFFEAMEKIGATDLNGTTNPDRTEFYENVPKNALDVALWIESDRMGHLLGSIDQARLDLQRGVVQNEKRQYENQPYGITEELITKGIAPPGHPYSWTPIGSMEDLDAASLADVKTWFTNYYGAANTVLVLAGDIDAETALEKTKHYFGEIPAGPPVARFEMWIPKIGGTRRQKVSDRVPQARLYKVWNVPSYGEPDNIYLGLLANVLVSGKTSRLYKRLIYDDQIATAVSAWVDPGEISGKLQIEVTVAPGAEIEKNEAAMNEEIARLLKDGPEAKELERARTRQITGFVRGAERIGRYDGKSDLLAMNETFRGSPDFYKIVLKYTREATPRDLQRSAKQWLTDDVYILEVHPYAKFETVVSTVDRSALPTPAADPEVKFPPLQRATLSNGLKVILAERHESPMARLNLVIDAGYAADQFAAPGTAKLTLQMLEEGTAHRTALEISDELSLLGASLDANSDFDSSTVSLSALTSRLNSALDIFADVILNPRFPEANLKRRQKELLAAIQQEKSEPFGMALRAFPRLLYGTRHAYGNPLTGSGTEDSVSKLSRADVRRFHDTWFKPNHTTLIIVGNTTLKEMMPKLEKSFGSWKGGDVPAKHLEAVEQQKKSAVYLIDRPGSIQSIILAGHVGIPRNDPDQIAVDTMNTSLGGTASSRINMNLREDKHWSYGAGSIMLSARGQGPFVAYAPVQSDKTKESILELQKELHAVLAERPITSAELSLAQKNRTLSLAGLWETIDAVANSISEIVNFRLEDDYFTTFAKKVRALSVNDISNATKKTLHPDQLVWIVVGDREKIESGLRELGWGEIFLLDADSAAVAHNPVN